MAEALLFRLLDPDDAAADLLQLGEGGIKRGLAGAAGVPDGIGVEVAFERGLVGRGDDHHVVGSGGQRLLDDELDGGLGADGQHLLRNRLRGGEEARAVAGGWNEGVHYLARRERK